MNTCKVFAHLVPAGALQKGDTVIVSVLGLRFTSRVFVVMRDEHSVRVAFESGAIVTFAPRVIVGVLRT